MKSKVLLLALAATLAGGAMAQDCTFFFPTTKGTQLVKKSYDAKNSKIRWGNVYTSSTLCIRRDYNWNWNIVYN